MGIQTADTQIKEAGQTQRSGQASCPVLPPSVTVLASYPLRYQEFRHPCLISLSPSVCQLHRQGAPSGHWQINDSWVASLLQGDMAYWTLWYVCNTASTHAPASLQISWINHSTFRPFWQVPQKSNKVQNTATTHYLRFTRYKPKVCAHSWHGFTYGLMLWRYYNYDFWHVNHASKSFVLLVDSHFITVVVQTCIA